MKSETFSPCPQCEKRAKRRRPTKKPPKPPEMTLRERCACSVTANKVKVLYSCKCSKCGFDHDIEIVDDLLII